MMLTLAEVDAADTITSTGARVIEYGLGTDYAVLIVLPVVLALLWVFIWKFGGGKELIGAAVSIVDTIKDSLVCAKEIAEIHERVVLRSPVEYQEVLRERARNPDHAPSPRLRKTDAAGA